jgi:hypothetical protein
MQGDLIIIAVGLVVALALSTKGLSHGSTAAGLVSACWTDNSDLNGRDRDEGHPQDEWGRVRGADGRQRWIKAFDLRDCAAPLADHGLAVSSISI